MGISKPKRQWSGKAKKKSPPKGRTFVDRKQTKAIVGLQKTVKRIVKHEPKYLIAEVTNSNLLNSTPVITLLNGVAQGDTNVTRNGNKLRFWSLEARFIITAGTSMTDPTPVRFMLVRKIKTVGATITLSNLLSDATPDVLDNFNVNNIDFKNTYKVYWDKTVVIHPQVFDNSATGTTTESLATGTSYRFMTIRTKLGGFTTDYGLGNAGNVGDIDTNGLFLISFTDNSTSNAVGFYHRHVLRCSEF